MAVKPPQSLSLVAIRGQSRQSNIIGQIDLSGSMFGLRIPEVPCRDRLPPAFFLFLREQRGYFLAGMLPTKVLATKGLASTCATWQELHW